MQLLKTCFIQFDHHARGTNAAADRARTDRFADKLFDPVHERQHFRIDCNCGFNAAGKAGRRRQVGNLAEIEPCRDSPHHLFVDAGLDERMPDSMHFCGLQSRPVLTEVVQVRTREDLC